MSFPSSQIYYVNSTHRVSGTHGHFTYSIPLPPNCNFDRVCLLQANIPITYYLIPDGYNTFVLTERKTGVNTSVTITVPPGNYNVNSFASIVGALLTAASPNVWTYTITFPNSFTSTQTGKFTFSVTGPVVGNGDTATFTINNSMTEQFGFDTSVSFSSTVTSTNVVNFIPETSILLHSDIVNDGDSDVFQEMFNNNSSPLSNCVYVCPDVLGYSKKLRTNQASIYSFSLTDEHTRPLNLNGVNCIFTMILFKQDTFTEMFRDYLKLFLLKGN